MQQIKRYGKILTAVAMLAALALAACRKEPVDTAGKREFTAFSYLAVEADERLVTELSGDRLYYVRPETDGYGLYASDMDTKQQEKIYGEPGGSGRSRVAMLAAAPNGQAALLKYKGDQTGGDTSDRKYSVAVLRPDGTIQADYDVTEYFSGGMRPNAMLTDGAGNVYFVPADEAAQPQSGGNARILAFGAAGNLAHTFTPEENEVLQHTVEKLFTDGEGHVYCVCSSVGASGDKLLQVMDLSLSKKTLREACRLTTGRAVKVFFAGNGGDILFSEGDVLYRLDLESGEKTELLRWMDVNINYGDIRELVLRENGDIGVYRSYANADTGGKWRYEVILLRDNEDLQDDEGDLQAGSGAGNQADASAGPEGTEDQVREQVILTYATMQLDDQMRSRIVNYNTEHPECRIEVKEYGQEGTEAGLLRLNTDILAGHAPDIIDLEDIDMGPYIAKGILTDLYPLMDADAEMGREEFVPGILKQYEENGKLYGIMAGYRLETLMGKESVVGSPSDWNIERMQEALARVPAEGCFIDNMEPLGLLRVLLRMDMGEYLDWENGTCSFDSEKFIKVLELAGSMGSKAMDGDMKDNLISGRITVNRIYVEGLSDYLSSAEMFNGEKVSCVGFPSAHGGAALVYPFRPMGISALNGHQDTAWAFVRTLLAEEFQTMEVRFNIPVRLSVLQKKLDSQAEIAAKREQPIAQEDMDAFYRLIDVPGGKLTFDINVWKIISEEAEYYFNGQKSAEEVAKTIQNRAGIYVGENY